MGATCSKDDGMAIDGAAAGLHQDDPYQQHLQQQQQQQSRKQPSGIFGGCMASCSGNDIAVDPRMDSCRSDAIDPVMYDLCKKSLKMSLQGELSDILKKKEEAAPPGVSSQASPKHSSNGSSSRNSKHPSHSSPSSSTHQQTQKNHNLPIAQKHIGQYHLLYKHQPRSSTTPTASDAGAAGEDHSNNHSGSGGSGDEISTVPATSPYSTRLIVRRRPIAAAEEGTHGTHLYAIRYPPDDVVESKKVMAGSTSESSRLQEQCPTPSRSSLQREKKKRAAAAASTAGLLDPAAEPVPEPRKPSPTVPQLPTEALTDFFQPAKMKQPKASKQTSEYCYMNALSYDSSWNGMEMELIAWFDGLVQLLICSFCPLIVFLLVPFSFVSDCFINTSHKNKRT